MEFKSPAIGRYVRVIAIISLLLGLNDAARLLGVNLGTRSPVEIMGVSAFVYSGIFSMARVFAGVGLWLKASWGAVLLIAATTTELSMYLVGHPDVRLSGFGFAVRCVLLVSIIALSGLALRQRMARNAD